jgi:hypothetical protein
MSFPRRRESNLIAVMVSGFFVRLLRRQTPELDLQHWIPAAAGMTAEKDDGKTVQIENPAGEVRGRKNASRYGRLSIHEKYRADIIG